MKTRVALLYGGRSGEHEISLRSAQSVREGLEAGPFEVVPYFIDPQGKWDPRPIVPEPGANPGIDVVFPVLHGTFGEDGTVQGLLELADLPYVGAGVMASAVAMDKDLMKRICRDRGLPVVEFVVLWREDLDAGLAERQLPYPMFVKPANLGSSVGITKARNRAELEAGLALAGQYDRKVLVERGIEGREFECAVLGNAHPEASAPCEILPSREFYDYEDKYLLDLARFELPARLPPEKTAEIRRLAVDAYAAVGGEGMARVDFLFENATGQLYVNEVNTIPGFTSISMYPKMWEASGVPFPVLVERLVGLAMERHAEKKATKYTK